MTLTWFLLPLPNLPLLELCLQLTSWVKRKQNIFLFRSLMSLGFSCSRLVQDWFIVTPLTFFNPVVHFSIQWNHRAKTKVGGPQLGKEKKSPTVKRKEKKRVIKTRFLNQDYLPKMPPKAPTKQITLSFLGQGLVLSGWDKAGCLGKPNKFLN